MRLKTYLVGLIIACAGTAFGQDAAEADTSYWQRKGLIGINMSQVALSNWNAGGQSSISGTALFNYAANYEKDKATWQTTIDLAYGLISEDNQSPQKTDDRIELNSKYGHLAVNKWYYSGLANFRTQFAEGFSDQEQTNLISEFFAPAYATVAIGMDYKPNKWFAVLISPLTWKGTFVMNQDLADAGAFGVDGAEYQFPDIDSVKIADGSTYRGEFGGSLNMTIQKEIMENVSASTRLNLFSNYSENPQNIDVNWELLISMKVNKYLSASITTNLIYDHDILIGIDDDGDDVVDRTAPRTQFKEVLAVGLAYQF